MGQRNWHVITGAPCSGKTAVIDELERRGHAVIREVARAYIDAQLASGLSLAMIKADVRQFERHILLAKVKIEASLSKTATIFFDRGIPDSIAYYQLEGLNPEEALEFSKATRYRRIFFFERFDFLKDGVRSEDEKTAARLDALLREAYRRSGYDLVLVPVMGIKDRTDLVLEHL